MIIETPTKPQKRNHAQPEAAIQISAVTWLWNNHPETRGMHFCVNNENSRSVYETKQQQLVSGAKRKAMGVMPGVSDTILLLARGAYHGCCCECKTPVGRQSDVQKQWQKLAESHGYFYFVYHSLEEFQQNVEWYLSQTLEPLKIAQ
jgi:hypothetical protein